MSLYDLCKDYLDRVECENGVIVVKTNFGKGEGRMTVFGKNLAKPHIYFDKQAGKFSVNQVKSDVVRSELLFHNAQALSYISRLNKGLSS